MKFKIDTVASKQMSMQKAKMIQQRRQEALRRRREEERKELELAALLELLRRSDIRRSPRQAQRRPTK